MREQAATWKPLDAYRAIGWDIVLILNGAPLTLDAVASVWEMRRDKARRSIQRGVVPPAGDRSVARLPSGKRIGPTATPRMRPVRYVPLAFRCWESSRSVRQFARAIGKSKTAVHEALRRGVIPTSWPVAVIQYDGRWLYRSGWNRVRTCSGKSA